MKACQHLKEQWEQSVRDEAVKREAKKKAKNPDKAKALDARDKATAKSDEPSNVEGAGGVARERDTSTEDDPLTAKSDGRKTTKRLRTSRADGASSELTSAVESMGSRQLEAAAETLKQQQQHHEEALRQAERARELEQRNTRTCSLARTGGWICKRRRQARRHRGMRGWLLWRVRLTISSRS
ncbi:unnamed protein product [Tilletia controversa]|nr:unnamed protein product [Tilletia controversa]